jgi:hypothetical protein
VLVAPNGSVHLEMFHVEHLNYRFGAANHMRQQ